MPNIEPAAASKTVEGMDLLTFISSIVGSLAWPLVAVLFILVFKKELTALARRLTKMTLPGGADLTFAEVLEETEKRIEIVEERIKVSPATIEVRGGEVEARETGPGSSNELMNDYEWIAKTYPHQAVAEAYREVEQALKEAQKVLVKAQHSDATALGVFQKSGVLSREMFMLWLRLKRLRDTAVHSRETVISEEEALLYRELCRRFIEALSTASEAYAAIPPVKDD